MAAMETSLRGCSSHGYAAAAASPRTGRRQKRNIEKHKKLGQQQRLQPSGGWSAFSVVDSPTQQRSEKEKEKRAPRGFHNASTTTSYTTCMCVLNLCA